MNRACCLVLRVWLLALLTVIAGNAPAAATTARTQVLPGRHAIVVGDNQGDASDPLLRYAELDARRMSEVLRASGGFPPENVAVLSNVSADDVRRTLIGLNARLRQAAPGQSEMLFVFYSGHADADALHLAGTRLALNELKDLTAGSSADTRVLVVDSCRSGALTRVKGGKPGPSFEVQIEAPGSPKGVAILTSSAAGEDSQESDELGASVFTHHLLSALMGAGDRNADGRVTIGEAFAYASERTLATTAATLGGAQHPTYHLNLGGRDDLTLTWPGASRDRGVLLFAGAGRYLVQQEGSNGPVLAELTSERGGGRLALPAGPYFVSERRRDFLRQDQFLVTAGATVTIEPEQMQRVEYARAVRKGTVERSHALSVVALGGVRGELLELGTAWRSALGLRLDLTAVSLELLASFGQSLQHNDWLGIRSTETALSAAGVHVFDLGGLSAGLGVDAGLAWFAQRFTGTGSTPRNATAGFVGPCAQLEVPFGSRFYARGDAALVSYLLQAARDDDLGVFTSYRVSLGAGAYF
jgi:hypothetical protein